MDMKNYSKPTAENKLSKGTIEKEYQVYSNYKGNQGPYTKLKPPPPSANFAR